MNRSPLRGAIEPRSGVLAFIGLQAVRIDPPPHMLSENKCCGFMKLAEYFAAKMQKQTTYLQKCESKRVRRKKGDREQGTEVSSQFTVHSSQFTVHSSQFTVHSSQFTVRSCLDRRTRTGPIGDPELIVRQKGKINCKVGGRFFAGRVGNNAIEIILLWASVAKTDWDEGLTRGLGATIPGPQPRGTGGALSALWKHHWDRGHPPNRPQSP